MPDDKNNRRNVDKTTRNFLITSSAEIDALASHVLARYLLSTFHFQPRRGDLPSPAIVKIVEKKFPVPLSKFHGFAYPTLVVAITHASPNYRGISLYFGDAGVRYF